MGSLLEPAVWDGKIFLGRWRDGDDGTTREVIDLVTGAPLANVGVASPADVALAAQGAARAQPAWGSVSAEYRAAVLHRVAQAIEDGRQEITGWLGREAGALPQTAAAEVTAAVRTCRYAAQQALAAQGELLPSAQPRLSLARRLPIGVAAVITPFNMPLALAIRAVAPALALGNAVVLKPDPRTAVSGGVVVAQAFSQAGLARGLLHVLPGAAEVGEALVADPRIGVVSFTGAQSTGRRVAELGGRLLKRVVLELGGSATLVVLDDANLDRVLPLAGHASFLHQGQVCMAAGRHLVHESLFDEYLERLARHAESLTVGPLIDAAQRDRVHRQVADSLAAGAKLVTGGCYTGLCYRPTVLAEPATPTPAFAGEVFGPVAAVRSFTDPHEVVELVAPGLAAAIMTGDVGRGMDLAGRLRTGMVHINGSSIDSEPQAPFGGFGDAGSGWRVGGEADLWAFTETQWLTVSQ